MNEDTKSIINKYEGLQQVLTFILNNTDNLYSIFPLALKHMNEVLGYDVSELWLVNDKKLIFQGLWGRKDFSALNNINSSISFEKGRRLPGDVWEAGLSKFFDDILNSEGFIRKEIGKKYNLNYCLGIPLVHKNEVLGVICFYKTTPDKPNISINVFDNFGKQVGELMFFQKEKGKSKWFEYRYLSLLEKSNDVIYVLNTKGEFIYTNPVTSNTFGLTRDELLGSGINIFNYDGEYEKLLKKTFNDVLESKKERSVEITTNTRYGEKYFHVRLIPQLNSKCNIESVLIIQRDISDIKNIEEQLRYSNQNLESLINALPIAIIAEDQNGNITLWNPAAQQIFGWSVNEVISKKDIIPAYLREEEKKIFNETLNGKSFAHIETKRCKKDGTLIDVTLSTYPIKNGNSIEGVMTVITDVTLMRQIQNENFYLSFYDSLTGLPNQQYFVDSLDNILQRPLEKDLKIAVLYINLDRFKAINDALGRSKGDVLLKLVAERFKQILKESPNITLSRFGSDKFGLMIPDLSEGPEASLYASKLISYLHDPFIIDDKKINLTASIGISVYPDDAKDSNELLINAESAMRDVKRSGRNLYRFSNKELQEKIIESAQIERILRDALESNSLKVYLQAKKDSEGNLIGFEALARLNDLKYPPTKFIPVAEETGLIDTLGRKVIDMVCRFNIERIQKGLVPLKIAVNVSPSQLNGSCFVEDLKNVLDKTGMPPKYLELEITEEAIAKNIDESIEILKEVRKLGIRTAIDDFGVGYSSLKNLKILPIDILKIDKSFIDNIPDNENDVAIVTAIISMAEKMNIEVIAEGVENEEQLQFLIRNHCKGMQGYYFSKPIPAEQFLNIRVEDIDKILVH